MTDLEGFLVAKAIEEAQRQRKEAEELVDLLETPGVTYTPEGRQAFAEGISIVQQRIALIDSLLQKLQGRN